MNAHEQWQLTMKAAELYERCPARYILGPWAPLLVYAARLAAGERVLYVAGAVARSAAEANLFQHHDWPLSEQWLTEPGSGFIMVG
jgi:hypothetical protein